MTQTHFRKQGSHWLAEAVSQFTRLAPNLKGVASGEVLDLTKLSKLTKICRKIRSQVTGIPCNSFRDWAPPEIANETARGPEGPHGSPKCPRNPISGAIVLMFGPLSCLGSHKCPERGPNHHSHTTETSRPEQRAHGAARVRNLRRATGRQTT